jgi:hypothetical protein
LKLVTVATGHVVAVAGSVAEEAAVATVAAAAVGSVAVEVVVGVKCNYHFHKRN